jgi:type 1 fimbria pilin
MPISQARRLLIPAVLLVSACTGPVPGVLTLAPAGMRLSGTCTPHADGTLAMAGDCSAESAIYVDAGTVTITVTAAATSATHPLSIGLWLGGTNLGTHRVESTDRVAMPFHGRASASGPLPLQLLVHADTPSAAAPAPTLTVEKVVVTEP